MSSSPSPPSPPCGPRPGRARVARAVVLALALAAAACAPSVEDPGLDFRASVTAEPVERGTVERLLETTGSVRATEEAKVVVESSGEMTLTRNPRTGRRWAVGDEVRRQEVVAVIDPAEAATTSRVESRRRALEVARADHERNLELFRQGLISETTLSESEVKLANAESDWQNARIQEAKSRLASPLAGVLTGVTTAADGSFQASGAEVVTVMAFDEVLVDLDLGTGDVLDVHPGQDVRVSTYTSREVFSGRVLRVAPAIDPETRTFRVEVLVPNPGRKLRPGMFVRAGIVLEKREDVVVVPPDALLERDGRLLVFVVEAQRAKRRTVEVGLVSEGAAEILEGLTEGERIVVSGQDTLQDGTRVIVRG